MSRGVVRWALGAAVMFCSVSAAAKPEYGAAIGEAAGAPCAPCLVCHTTNTGGSANLNAAGFAVMVGAGFDITKPDQSASTALNTLGMNMTDSDADGVFDFDEIAAGTNPFVYGDENMCIVPTYGCLSVSTNGPDSTGIAVTAFGLLGYGLFARRRRRRS